MFQLPAGPECTARRGFIVRAGRELGAPGRLEPTLPLDFKPRKNAQIAKGRTAQLSLFALLCVLLRLLLWNPSRPRWIGPANWPGLPTNQTKSNQIKPIFF
jgi:hypothetical protein